MIKVGIIGVGGIAGAHLGAYGTMDDVQVVALCDKIPERASGTGKSVELNIGGGDALSVTATPYTDYRQLLADDTVELVDICLPTDLHAEVTVAALRAGKHVLCEKPMALTVEECDRMVAAAQQTGRTLMIAHCIRFWPEYIALKEIVDSGKYGKVVSAGFQRLSPLPIWSSEGWLTDPARSGGAALDLHIHDADFVRYLLGSPSSVTARVTEDAHGASYIMADYHYGGEEIIYAEGGWLFPAGFPFRMNFLVRLEGATAEWNAARGPLTIYPEGGDPFTPPLLDGGGHSREITYLVQCLAQGTQPEVVTPFDARESVRLVHAELTAARTGQSVTY
ncbi:MAG TPA: Gfo/Idh/MocA family oxidoreductase [Armatimonadota bacterium]